MTVRDSDGSRLDPPGDWDSLRELLVAAVGERCLDSVLDLLEFHFFWLFEEVERLGQGDGCHLEVGIAVLRGTETWPP